MGIKDRITPFQHFTNTEDDDREQFTESPAIIKVLGVGGAGNNAVNNMILSGLKGVEFIAANTDAQVLKRCLSPIKIQLGTQLTRGLGAGGNPEVGAKAAEEDIEKIKQILSGSDMVFITAGLGGGTGTGAAPVIAKACQELGILTVAIVTKPFSFEGRIRLKNAQEGLARLQDVVDTLITIPNDRLVTLADKRASFLEMFKKADDILYYAVKGISDLIVTPGYINVDFNDVKTVMSERGMALMGTGVGRGENRAVEAAQQAISSPLLEDISIKGARAVLVNITASPDMAMHEFEEASSIIHSEVDPEANINIGMAFDPEIGDELRITVIATGIGGNSQSRTCNVSTSKRYESKPTSRYTSSYPSQPLQSSSIPKKEEQKRIFIDDDVYEGSEIAISEPNPEKTRRIYGEESERKHSLIDRFKRKFTSDDDEEDLSIPTFIRRRSK
ncbi:MAG: cell division protein FtsZ [Syntrophobacterales bacterium]|nr:cell division protein FtsZ [Syntrophobacterales bacterium]